VSSGCSDDDSNAENSESAAGGGRQAEARDGSFVALTYNVAGLPERLSQSMPLENTPVIGPLLNDYDLVFLQESWQTPDPNPLAPLRTYHEILVDASAHPYKTVPATQPFGNDPARPSALLSDGLNIFSELPLGDTTRVMWSMCNATGSDCLALKGFSLTPATLPDGTTLQLYDLHMEAGETRADDDLRAMDVDQLLAFLEMNSRGEAVIVAGDFNMVSDTEPAKSQLARLLMAAGLTDACAQFACSRPGNLDKILYRSGERVTLEATSWNLESDVFVGADGMPLSDHDPVAVHFAYHVQSE
jgi:endonuclease/exonuclease/phosphatase family metal-dependent hydrolase